MFGNDQCRDGNGDSLDASLLITATTGNSTTTSTTSSSGKYASLWRRTITVTVLISLKKTNSPEEGSLSSPTSSSPLITEENHSDSLQQQANNPVHESSFLGFVSKACNSFSRRSFKNQDASASTSSYVPVPTTPTADQGLSRNLSTQSWHAIDIPSDNEVEEKSEQQRLVDDVDRIVQQRDLNKLKEIGGVEKAALAFRSHLENGIDAVQEPKVWETNNVIRTKGFLYFLLQASISLTNLLLLVSAALSFTAGIIKQGAKYGWHDGITILATVSVLVTFSSVGNFRKARKLEKKLWKEKNKLEVEVVRSGTRQFITVSNVVAGDIVHLKEGDRVSADGVIVRSNGLVVDDVLNPKIDNDSNPFLFYGSKVKQGNGTMLVTSVGYHRKLDKLMRLLIREPNERTLLETQLEKPNSFMENISLIASVLIALVLLIRLLCRKHDEGDDAPTEPKGNASVGILMKMFEKILFATRGKISILTSALAVAVIAVQHGMPFAITTSLSVWTEKVEGFQAKPQNLSACATLGIATVFCIDATGGLVCNDMEVDKFWIGEKNVNNDINSGTDLAVIESLKRGIGASVLVPDISIKRTSDLFVSWAKLKWNLDLEFLDRNLSLLQYRKLSSGKKGFGILMKNNGDEGESLHIHWSGAASTILDMCSHYYDCEGNSHAIGDEKGMFQEVIKEMEDNGLTPFAFAGGQTEIEEIKDDGMHLLALAGLKFPCLEEIKLEVEALRNSGVRIMLVSEDELSAVRAIGRELGIFKPEANGVALEGKLQDLTVNERVEKINQMNVMGSCDSDDKLLVVQSLQQKGHVVALLGGSSSNDIPALKQADVGISKDSKSTEIARECSDIIIAVNGTLPPILKFGRCAYNNIQKFSQLQLTVCISSLLITLVTTMSLGESPISTIQLIWVNGAVCLLGGLMMVMELQDHKPGKRTLSLLTPVMWENIAIQVLCQAFLLLIFQFKGQVIPSLNKDIRKAMIFNSFTLCQVFNQLNAMGLVKKDVLAVVLRNYMFLMALGTVLVIQVLLVEFVNPLVGYERLNGVQWGGCFLIAASSWGLHCVANFILDASLNWYHRSGLPSGRYWPNFSCLINPFSVLLLFFLTYYYYIPGVTDFSLTKAA